MKLLMLIPAIADIYGGTSKIVTELSEALGSYIDVDIVTTNANGNSRLNFPLNRWIVTKSYRIQYFHYWSLGNYIISPSLNKWLEEHIGNYDLVHIHGIFSPVNLSAYWNCQKNNIPYIISPHGMLEPWALRYKSWKKTIYYNLFEKPALQKASFIHMSTDAEAKRIDGLKLSPPIALVPNGVHCRDFETLLQTQIFYEYFPHTRNKLLILFLARLDPKKGLDLLAQAFSQIRSRFPTAHLVVAGPDNIGFLNTAKNYFATEGSLEEVTFTGMLTGELKLSALAAASIFVSPSYSEGFSMSVLEAMAAGLPCVITTGCNFPEAQAANAALVVDIDATKIAEAICQCLEDPHLAQQMGTKARQMIFKQYTWDRIASQLIQVYKTVVSSKLEFTTFTQIE